MSTALDVIKRAMRLCQVYSLGEEPSDDEANNGLAALNGMLDQWSTNSLMVPVVSILPIPIVGGTSVYTLGATGTVITTRPIQAIDSCYVVYANVSYPCPLLSTDKYDSIAYKPLTTQFPRAIWYQPDYPDATLTVYPTPSADSVLNFSCLVPLGTMADLTTDIVFPPGYYDALCFNLAVNYGPELGAQVPPTVLQTATNTKRMLKRVNTRVPGQRIPALLTTKYRSRIIDGP